MNRLKIGILAVIGCITLRAHCEIQLMDVVKVPDAPPQYSPNGIGFTNIAETVGIRNAGPGQFGSDGAYYGGGFTGGNMIPPGVYRVWPSTNGYQTIRYFKSDGSEGLGGRGGFSIGTNGSFFGVAPAGGTNNAGTLYAITTDVNTNDAFHLIMSFPGGTGPRSPFGPPLVIGDVAYGTTQFGGSSDVGTVYALALTNRTFLWVDSFTTNICKTGDSTPVLGPDGKLYFTCVGGGTSSAGSVVRVNLDGTGLTNMHSFSGTGPDGSKPVPDLVLGRDGKMYGVTWGTNSYNTGTAFSIDTNGIFATIASWHEGQEVDPQGLCLGPAGSTMMFTSIGYGTSANAVEVWSVNPDGTMVEIIDINNGGVGQLLANQFTLGPDNQLYSSMAYEPQWVFALSVPIIPYIESIIATNFDTMTATISAVAGQTISLANTNTLEGVGTNYVLLSSNAVGPHVSFDIPRPQFGTNVFMRAGVDTNGLPAGFVSAMKKADMLLKPYLSVTNLLNTNDCLDCIENTNPPPHP